MTLQEKKTIESLGRLDAQIEYLNEMNKLWKVGLLSNDELQLRLTVLEEQQEVWDMRAQDEEDMDRGSEADQMADYMEAEPS